GLDDAGEPDPDEPSLRPRRFAPGQALLAPRKLERLVEARLVVARVVEAARRRPVGKVGAAHEVATAEVDRIEIEPPRRDLDRPLEREVELRPAEAAVEAGRRAVRE